MDAGQLHGTHRGWREKPERGASASASSAQTASQESRKHFIFLLTWILIWIPHEASQSCRNPNPAGLILSLSALCAFSFSSHRNSVDLPTWLHAMVAAIRVQKFTRSHAAICGCYICTERAWCEANNKYMAKVKIYFIFSPCPPTSLLGHASCTRHSMNVDKSYSWREGMRKARVQSLGRSLCLFQFQAAFSRRSAALLQPKSLILQQPLHYCKILCVYNHIVSRFRIAVKAPVTETYAEMIYDRPQTELTLWQCVSEPPPPWWVWVCTAGDMLTYIQQIWFC